MIKKYHGNFSRLIKDGKTFTNYIVHGRETQRIADRTYHVIGMDTLINFSLRSRVMRYKDYTIIRDAGRYHIFK